jgi:membrane-bound lytic murein transglycosylase MltF
MAIRSQLKLRSRRLAMRILTICFVQSVVIAYLVLDFAATPNSLAFPRVEFKSPATQFTVSEELQELWAGENNHDETQLASFTCHCRPHDGQQQEQLAEIKRQLQIERMISDFQVGFSDAEVGQLAQVIDSESRRYKYDPRLLLAVILTESSLRKGVSSCQGAHGLMQIKPIVAEDLAMRQGINWQGQTSLFDPSYNIRLGSLYLFELLMKYGDIRKALIAYNLGETEMRNRLLTNRELPSQYVQKVMARYQELVEKYPDA